MAKRFPKVYEVCAENKCGDLIEAFASALKEMGIHMAEDLRYEGSDMYGFLLSKKKLTKKQIRQIKEEWESYFDAE